MGKAARVRALKVAEEAPVPAEPLRLDFGCGPNKREGFKGVDAIQFVGVDFVVDVRSGRWPWADGSVEQAHASHFLEHLTATERCHFFNELYRVLKPGGQCLIITPHWASNRAYGDPTHQWPPVCEMTYSYLLKSWRAVNAPHTDMAVNQQGYACDFDATYYPNLREDLASRNDEYRQYAYFNFKEAAQDLIATVTKRA